MKAAESECFQRFAACVRCEPNDFFIMLIPFGMRTLFAITKPALRWPVVRTLGRRVAALGRKPRISGR